MRLNTKIFRLSTVIFVSLLLFAGITHGLNMFKFPYYENDEGTYMSQAWSLLKEGKLAPYTYWYDHAPGGWILIAIWVFLTGGFFTFGPSVNSGRVLMLVLHVLIAAIILFLLNKEGKKNSLAGAIAVIIFSLSPLGMYFQRRVLLDNIMTFWVFVSLFFLLREKLKLSHVIYSSIVFGIAVLSKENAVFFAPVLLYLVWTRSDQHYRYFAFFKWILISGFVISLYFLYAFLKHEFFPVGFMGDTSEHVSLLTTLKDQYSRGENIPFWNPRSDFYQNLVGWLDTDFFIITAGIISTIINFFLAIKNRKILYIPLLSLFFWIFLIRGKLVLNFYIVPLLPILAMNIGVTLDYFINTLGKRSAIILTIAPVFILLLESTDHFVKDEVSPQVEAIEWIKTNVPANSKLVIDDSIYVDLHDARFPGDPIYPNADWSWKVEKDPEVYEDKLKRDWKNLEYIVLSHEMLKQIKDDKFNFIQKGLDNSFSVAEWTRDSSSYIDVNNYLSTNGDWMAVYKVNDRDLILLSETWKYYKDNYIKSYGQVIDPSRNNQTTSEGQSYAMLRAVWQNDKKTFDGVWKWTQDHLQHRTQDKLVSWLWVNENGEYRLGDSEPASDADQDIALALLFASQRWKDPYYLSEAHKLLSDIWENEVKQAGNRFVLLPGVAGFESETEYVINPSYISPAWYRIFSEADPTHPWLDLANDSYLLLDDISSIEGNLNLPPNWVTIDKKTGKPTGVATTMGGGEEYSFDAFRIFWRIALDKLWFQSPSAETYLSKYKPFFESEWNTKKRFTAVYTIYGEEKVDYSSLSTTVGPLSIFTGLDTPEKNDVFSSFYQTDNAWWGDKNNYYDQNWAWMGVSIYKNLLPNLWKRRS